MSTRSEMNQSDPPYASGTMAMNRSRDVRQSPAYTEYAGDPVAPVKSGQVQVVLKTLESQVARQHELLETLASRLDPVLMREPQSNTRNLDKSDKCGPSYCPLAEHAAYLEAKVREANEAIDYLLSRLSI